MFFQLESRSFCRELTKVKQRLRDRDFGWEEISFWIFEKKRQNRKEEETPNLSLKDTWHLFCFLFHFSFFQFHSVCLAFLVTDFLSWTHETKAPQDYVARHEISYTGKPRNYTVESFWQSRGFKYFSCRLSVRCLQSLAWKMRTTLMCPSRRWHFKVLPFKSCALCYDFILDRKLLRRTFSLKTKEILWLRQTESWMKYGRQTLARRRNFWRRQTKWTFFLWKVCSNSLEINFCHSKEEKNDEN